MTENQPEIGICGRVADLRRTCFGPRGRAAFARALNVSPSTYNYYEKGRQPPADLLARAAAVTGASLEWLMTGAGEPFPSSAEKAGDNTLSQGAREVLARLQAPGGAAGARSALREILATVQEKFPPREAAWRPSAPEVKAGAIPILGRTAAGLLAKWDDCFAEEESADALDHLLASVDAKAGRQRGAAVAAADPQDDSSRPADATAMLIQLSEPTPEGILEFLQLPGLAVGPGAFALRVDGDSMAPRILDGDIIVCRRGVEPQPGQTAVVKVRGRVGVTVKLWRPEGDFVHLIPINESYEPGRALRVDILWACRCLWVVRL